MTNNDSQNYMMPEGSQRNNGRNAQRMNILAAKLVAEAIRTTLGPKGMDKMLVDSLGEVIVTNDGVTILREMDVEHPAAKMIIEVAKTQEEEVGDGTTTAVILAGELLKKAEELLDKKIHPTVISKGYKLAAIKAIEILNKISEDVDETSLRKICETAMTGKGSEDAKEHLSKIILEAVKLIDKNEDPRETIFIEKKTGASISESKLIKGIILDKEKTHGSMPKTIQNAKIALIESPIEIKSTETDSKISITDPERIQQFLDMEEKMIKNIVLKIISSGANVVICQKGIDELAQHYLQKAGIYACRRVKKSDMSKLSKATGAKSVTDIQEITKEDLGEAGLVHEVKVGEDFMTYIENCQTSKLSTILVRGSTSHIVDEAGRAIEDALGDLTATLKNNKVVAGAAATEMILSKSLAEYSEELSGREQLAVKAYSESLEIIPKTLAENAGLDPIDVLTELKANQSKIKWAGIDVYTGKVIDSWKEGIIEPLNVKTQAITSSTDVANMILRIDDVILAETNKESKNIDE
ncbi:TCP-1/cpn60 chaperonin family protein [Candidatus Woesearchaeota archaeon]|nr:TCP-1/cpn60 chaperonin family protein [Candidatus Woesearchaeota archaeon]MCF7901150.1 TCP-1/cpn60 chaperonin family protein [Candidatus Woesearchaeota archaeon]MCF8013673.1 TCP-1/cpn60 chaperonin family protein [Candidatus Woesearchaeota archaeon]